MFAVLKTGGKQYKVASGDILRVEKLAADAGETVQFNEILMLGGDAPVLGVPLVADAGVQAEVIDQIKADKVIHYVKRRRKHSSQRTKGHRQQLTLLRVTGILASGAGSSGIKAALGAASPDAISAAAPKKAAPKKATPKKSTAPAAAIEAGSKPANLLSEARDGKADDLKKISGVGPKLEDLLHENGVFHYDQIADWSAGEVDYMGEKLSFKGRIEREGWIDQAKALAEGKE